MDKYNFYNKLNYPGAVPKKPENQSVSSTVSTQQQSRFLGSGQSSYSNSSSNYGGTTASKVQPGSSLASQTTRKEDNPILRTSGRETTPIKPNGLTGSYEKDYLTKKEVKEEIKEERASRRIEMDAKSTKSGEPKGLKGLRNIGNTCYM